MKELLFSVTKNDFEFTFFRSSGPGGQHKNTTDSACRCRHVESGAMGVATEDRHQHKNKIMAFKRCVNTKEFKNWLKRKTSEALMEESVEEKVDRLMSSNNIRTEVKENNKWKVVTDLEILND